MTSVQAVAGDRASEAVFFRNLATVMAVVQVSGFLVQLAMGRSSFGAPPVVHAHAIAAMGWVGIFAGQTWLAASGARDAHRRIGPFALAWAVAFVALGVAVTTAAARTGRVPFFFQPQHFLIANPMTTFGFLGLLLAAVALRHRPDWHARLQIGAFVMIMGPTFGRLLPAPLMIPWAFEGATLPALAFPLYGMVRDARVHGRPHPAWIWPFVLLAATLVLARLLADSSIGEAIYAFAISGSPANPNGLAYPPPPPM